MLKKNYSLLFKEKSFLIEMSTSIVTQLSIRNIFKKALTLIFFKLKFV